MFDRDQCDTHGESPFSDASSEDHKFGQNRFGVPECRDPAALSNQSFPCEGQQNYHVMEKLDTRDRDDLLMKPNAV